MTFVIKPVRHADRQIFMDVLRGFAIFGILVANLTTGGFSLGYRLDEESPFIFSELDQNFLLLLPFWWKGNFIQYSVCSLVGVCRFNDNEV